MERIRKGGEGLRGRGRAVALAVAALAASGLIAADALGDWEVCSAAASCRSGAPASLGGEFDQPSDAAVSSTGDVYVVDAANQRVQEFDSSGNFIRAWGRDVVSGGGTEAEICAVAADCKAGSIGGLGGEFSEPRGIAIDSADHVYVTEAGGERVQEFDSAGNFLRAWGKNVDGANPSTGAEVCQIAANCLVGSVGSLGGELFDPSGIAIDPSGNIFVAEGFGNRVQKFDGSGNFLLAWGEDVDSGGGTGAEVCTVAANCLAASSGSLGGELSGPAGVTTDSLGNVYVAEASNNRVQKFDGSGNFLLAWGKDVDSGGGTGAEVCTVAASCKMALAGSLGGEFQQPLGLSADPSDTIYVADSINNRVQVFSPFGAFVAAWGKDANSGGGTGAEVCAVAANCQAASPGGLGGELSYPEGGAVDPATGDGFVVDTGNNRIQKVDPFGAFVLAWGSNVLSDTQPTPPPSSSPPPGSPSQALPPPRFGASFNATVVSGRVRVKEKGSRGFHLLTAGEQLPVNSTLDTRRGRVRLTSAKTRNGGTQTADFYHGVFAVRQPKRGKPITILALVDSVAPRRAAARRGRRKSNGLWGSGKGHFRSKGRHGSATVRGTIWFTQDRPNGTFFKVKRGVVLVHDFTRHRKLKLRAGRHYLARAR